MDAENQATNRRSIVGRVLCQAVQVLCFPHWCVLIVGFLGTTGLRLRFAEIGLGIGSTGTASGFVAANALMCGLMGTLFVLVERWRRGAVIVALLSLLSLVFVFVWVLDTGSLLRTGTPLQYSHVVLVLSELHLLAGIAGAEVGGVQAGLVLSSPLILLVVSAVFGRRRRKVFRERSEPISVVLPGLLVLLGATLTLTSGFAPQVVLSENVHFRVLGQSLMAEEGTDLGDEVFEPELADPELFGRSGQLPSIVIVLLESTGTNAVEASLTSEGTPNLRSWRELGTVYSHIRTTIPHTSKALVSILCGVYPARNREIVEASDNYPLTCLPHILRTYGYRSLFVQSADGTYERRVALVDRMGFDSFLSPQDRAEWERLGYFNGDEAPMLEQVDTWVNSGAEPFLVVVLTSLTHHPYTAPSSWSDSQSINNGDRPHRYARLVTHADAFAAELTSLLEVFQRPDRLLVVLGDHGEKVATEGLRFHNNVWFEQVLRIPLLFIGPNVATGDVVNHQGSAIDIVPTILAYLDIPIPPLFDGISLASHDGSERFLFSASWLPHHWTSVTRGRFKLVRWSESGEVSLFDTTADVPDEPLIGADHPELRSLARELDREVQAWERNHIIDIESAIYRVRLLYNEQWGCELEGCWHIPTGVGIPSHAIGFEE